jgi:hypothetical protein
MSDSVRRSEEITPLGVSNERCVITERRRVYVRLSPRSILIYSAACVPCGDHSSKTYRILRLLISAPRGLSQNFLLAF